MTKDEALRMAIDALKYFAKSDRVGYVAWDESRGSEAMNACREALAQPEKEKPFEIGKRVAQEGRGISDLWGAVANDSDLPEAQRGYEDALAQPEQEPVSHTVIAGALFDFMGYLTSRQERIVLSAADDASPAVDAIRDFAKKRGLSLDDAQVREWIDNLAQPEQVKPWVGLTDEENHIAEVLNKTLGLQYVADKLQEKNT
tara:strand:+ start:1599 stop:2201 length:603 start_codon:yes stop_codon:yes gene_type:complete